MYVCNVCDKSKAILCEQVPVSMEVWSYLCIFSYSLQQKSATESIKSHLYVRLNLNDTETTIMGIAVVSKRKEHLRRRKVSWGQ